MKDVRTGLLAEFGTEALKAIAAVVAEGHVRARRVGSESFGVIGVDRCGLVRWMWIDAQLMALAGRFPGMSVSLESSEGGGPRHVEITKGGYSLLISHDREPDTLMPKTNYGRIRAASNQFLLFDEPAESAVELPAALRYWAILFHSKAEVPGTVPSVLEIRFPDGADQYVASAINLYMEFPELVNPTASYESIAKVVTTPIAAVEVVENTAAPTLRAAKKAGA